MVATPVLLLLHTPPTVSVENADVLPAQKEFVPVIAAGSGLTVTTAVLKQPALTMYEIVDVPSVNPATTPVPTCTVAFTILLLLHVPPPDEDRVVVDPIQVLNVPVTAPGEVFTVTSLVRMQPVAAW
jgi:hypothetical protein